MAQLEVKTGTIRARCPGCGGALAAFEWKGLQEKHLGVIASDSATTSRGHVETQHRFYRCGGCGRGALAELRVTNGGVGSFPPSSGTLLAFWPETIDTLTLPDDVPEGIRREFREGESCIGANCDRAAAGMFRSVLDKTLRANGYKVKDGTSLAQQIDMAAVDGVITEARRLRAHDEIRVLGNDVLHDEWHTIPREDVLAARHYAQRILEDFYDDRPPTLKLLRSKNRETDEVRAERAVPTDLSAQ